MQITKHVERTFPSFPGPLYQNEVKCSAFDMEMIFPSHANKTHFHRKVVHLASFWKWGFLELGSGLLHYATVLYRLSLLLLALTRLHWKLSLNFFPQNSPIVQFDDIPPQSHSRPQNGQCSFWGQNFERLIYFVLCLCAFPFLLTVSLPFHASRGHSR